jgi:hypothetical protein
MLSPFVALRTLASAAKAGDRDVIALSVDFPALRDSLKSQFNAFLARKAAEDPDLKNNPFAGLAVTFVPMLVNRMVDNFVTPDGIAGALKRPIHDAGRNSAMPALWNGSFSYLDLDHFKATYANAAHPDQPIGIILERHGLFKWKITVLDLPLDQLVESTNAGHEPSPKSQQSTLGPPPAARRRPYWSAMFCQWCRASVQIRR